MNQIKLQVSAPAENGWASYNRYDQQMKLQAAPFPYVDGFTLELMKALSKGSMGGKQSFGEVHPDLLLEAWANRNGLNFQSLQEAPGKVILSAQWALSQEQSPERDSNNTMRGILSLTLSPDASDEDGVLRFKGPQVRLVGKSGQSYWPMGIHLDNMPWSKLYGDLSDLAMPGDDGKKGYLRYNKADYRLWAKDEQEQRIIRREIRGCDAGQLWWQLQLLGESGDLRVLPASFGVLRDIGKQERATIKLIFEITEGDDPDYVVFKRTAMRTIPREEKPAEQTEKSGKSESGGENPDR